MEPANINWTSLVESLKSTGITNRQEEMSDLVERLCNQNSGTYNLDGLALVKQMLVGEFESLGGEMSLIDVEPEYTVDSQGESIAHPLGQAISISKRPEKRPRIVLCIHMDTVYGVDHPFQRCRRLDDRTLNGPGVADAKGGLVVMLHALRAFEQTEFAQHVGWEVIINPDEEIGSVGSRQLLAERAAAGDVGLLFEPCYADGTLVSWRKGTGNFAFVFRGRNAHSGREFERGRNAIVACCRMMDEVFQLNQDTESTFNVGRISGGNALNIVPDLAIGRVNARVKTPEHQRQAESQFQQLVDKYNRLNGLLEGITCEQFGQFTSPPKPLTDGVKRLQQRVDACAQALNIETKWGGSGGASDGNKFAAAGLTNIDTLGPVGGNIHSADEYLMLDSLVPRAQLTALIMMSIAISPTWPAS